MKRTVSGISLSKKKNVVVVKNDHGFSVYRIRGRWFYCKKTRRKESVGGIIIPDKSRGNTQFVIVLAMADGCGKKYKLSKEQKILPDMKAGIKLKLDIHDKILCPESHLWGIWRSPISFDEFFIHECIPITKVSKE